VIDVSDLDTALDWAARRPPRPHGDGVPAVLDAARAPGRARARLRRCMRRIRPRDRVEPRGGCA